MRRVLVAFIFSLFLLQSAWAAAVSARESDLGMADLAVGDVAVMGVAEARHLDAPDVHIALFDGTDCHACQSCHGSCVALMAGSCALRATSQDLILSVQATAPLPAPPSPRPEKPDWLPLA